MTDRAEGTLGCLRYILGGDRPSQTDHQAVSPAPIQGPRLDSKLHKAGISTAAPRDLATPSQSLPAILHKSSPNSISSYSKAPRGLFVLLRVRRIFTPSSISPGPSLRQCPIRYAFRAGRNLPDKEFRYLRTVIVTAAVHRGFSSKLRLR